MTERLWFPLRRAGVHLAVVGGGAVLLNRIVRAADDVAIID